jgi:hypothetical protein
MCMGYTQEIRAWICNEMQNQRHEMLQAWSTAFEQSGDTLDAPFKSFAFQVAEEYGDICDVIGECAEEHVALSTVRPTQRISIIFNPQNAETYAI